VETTSILRSSLPKRNIESATGLEARQRSNLLALASLAWGPPGR